MNASRRPVPPTCRFLAAPVVLCVLVASLAAAPAMAQYTTDPPEAKPARWNGRTWGVVDMTPKVIRPGDTAVLEATLRDGGPAIPSFYCSSGAGWRVQGTMDVSLKYTSVCFELVDYEPKASQYVTVSVGPYEVHWTGLSGDPPTASVARELNPNAGAECYCKVDWWGAYSKTDGCSKPIGTFGRGQVFRLYLKARHTPTIRGANCSTFGKYMRSEAAYFSGNYGPNWSDTAVTYYRFDTTNTGGARPVPAIAVAADPVILPSDAISTITATVTDPATGKPMPGQRVNFSTTVGVLSSLAEFADANGVVTVTVASDGKAGTAKVRASVGGEEAAAYASVEFTGPPPASDGDPVLRQYFAEGATGPLFTTDLALANPGEAPARATLKFLTEAGEALEQQVTVPSHGRKSVRLNTDVPGLGATGVATVVESAVPLMADRTMTWDGSGYGSHTETSVAEPRLTWYLAEGATHSGFQLFYLIQNAADASTDVEIKYLRPAPLPPLVRRETIGPRTRRTIWVNYVDPGLSSTDVSAVITSSLPVVVERAMYLNTGGRLYAAGHESAGVAEPQARWFFAEGATGPYFDLFILVANPDTRTAQVKVTFLRSDGVNVEKIFAVEPESRRTFWVDVEGGPEVADAAVSTVVEAVNGVPVIAERAMWWPGTPSPAAWQEAHNAPGSTRTAARWMLADCEVGGPRAVDTYLLVANTSDTASLVHVKLLFEDGTTVERAFDVAARSRFNVHVASEFPSATGRRFSALVQSLGTSPAQIVVERAVYSDANGVHWAAGANSLGTPLAMR